MGAVGDEEPVRGLVGEYFAGEEERGGFLLFDEFEIERRLSLWRRSANQRDEHRDREGAGRR